MAPTQKALSGVPKVSGSNVMKTRAPAYTVTDTLVKTYAIRLTTERAQRVRALKRRSRNSGIVNTPLR